MRAFLTAIQTSLFPDTHPPFLKLYLRRRHQHAPRRHGCRFRVSPSRPRISRCDHD